MQKVSLLNRFIVAFVRWLWSFRRVRGRRFLIDHLLPVVRVMATRYGPVIRVHRHDFTNRAAIFGTYGDEVAGWVRSLRDEDLFLDIGANAGIFSLIADECVPGGKVFSFEPNANLYEDLRFNIGLNDARRVVPLNIALSDHTGTFQLAHNPGHTGGGSLRDAGVETSVAGVTADYTVVAVAPRFLDAVIEAAQDRDVCIKIDVEGHELCVLRGLDEAGLLAKARWVIAEIDPSYLERFSANAEMIYQLMESRGFRPTKGLDVANHYDELFVRGAVA
jgi:FkbM family methyltransferase